MPVVGSPPLARGKAYTKSHLSKKTRITPACAGKRGLCAPCKISKRDHPRLRGEKRAYRRSCDSKQWITPACAGKSSIFSFNASLSRDHPRLRGEKRHILSVIVGHCGSPPLARGKALFGDLPCPQKRITPACAGKSSSMPWRRAREADHPRLRGEKHHRHHAHGVRWGSPPLARGKAFGG